ncbi:hypothetical protein REPUB_Repub11eG0098100 [Reevesia pubescens]
MNKALLVKLGWKLEEGDSGLWARVLCAKYMKGESFLKGTKTPASHTWRSIISSKYVVAKGCSKLIPSDIAHCKVSELVDCNGQWEWNWLSCLPIEVREQLSLIQLNPLELDQMIWAAANNGLFSVKTAYDLSLDRATSDFDWNKVWKLDAPPGVKHFLWLVSHNRLLTKEVCFNRHFASSTSCRDVMELWKVCYIYLETLLSLNKFGPGGFMVIVYTTSIHYPNGSDCCSIWVGEMSWL